MLVIGLTGNLGTGKTTVSQILAELGAAVINADRLGHELYQPNSPVYSEVVAAFGNGILRPDGQIDRQKLGQIVFADAAALERLDRITHPRIYQIVKRKIEEYRRSGTKVVVLEAALLIEAGWRPLVDQLWATIASESTIAERLKHSRGLTEQQTLIRLRTQMPQEEKARQADVVINTDCSMDELKSKVTELWRNLHEPS